MAGGTVTVHVSERGTPTIKFPMGSCVITTVGAGTVYARENSKSENSSQIFHKVISAEILTLHNKGVALTTGEQW